MLDLRRLGGVPRFLVMVVAVLPMLLRLAFVPMAWAQADDPLAGLMAAAPAQEDLSLTAQFTTAKPGEPARLFVTARPAGDWHLYSITQPPGGPRPTTITVSPSGAFKLLGAFRAIQAAERKPEPAFDNLIVESHYGEVTWYAPIELTPGVDPVQLVIDGKVNLMLCSESGCKPPADHRFTARLGSGVELPVGGSISPASPSETARPPESTSMAPPSPTGSTEGPPSLQAPASIAAETATALQQGPTAIVFEDSGLRDKSLIWAMAVGFIGGLILNIMPCVLPVIGLKILSFVEQSGHDRWRALSLNLWYSGGLLSVFLLLATLSVFLGLGWGQLFSYQGFSITLSAVIFTMALSFLGVWEVPIPGFVGRGKAVELAAREGPAGAFSKGVLTTVLATPCSAPFLASALAWMATKPPVMAYAVFLSAGLGMASPYLLIGAYPQLMRFLPKPGEWMDTFKQLMGFVLLGTVVFLMSFMAFQNMVPTVALLFGLWGACWWIGRMPETVEQGEKVRRWLEAAGFAGLIWVIAFPGIGGVLPFGSLAKYMQQRLERPVFSKAELQRAVASKNIVMVDFTADWCLTCKTLEATVLHTEPVQKAMREKGVQFMVADWTEYEKAKDVTEMLDALGSRQVPVIAIFPPGKINSPIVFRGGYTQQQLLDALDRASR